MWKLDLEDNYFRIYDSKKLVAGYFDPDYGNVYPKDNADEIITQMHKNKDKIPGGYVMVPMVKYNLFDSDLNIGINDLLVQTNRVLTHVTKWKEFLSETNNELHYIRISHTDQDMLTITFPLKFSQPVRLDKSELVKELAPLLDHLQVLGLL